MTERAIARLSMYPLLKEKIDVLKACVKTFKDPRQNDTKVKSSKNASDKIHSKDTSYSNDDAIKLQHEGTIISEQNDKEAKILAMKSINSTKGKTAMMEHGPKTMDIPNSPLKNSVVPSESQKTPADPKMKMFYQTTQKKSDSSLGGNSDDELHEEEKEYSDDSIEERLYSLPVGSQF